MGKKIINTLFAFVSGAILAAFFAKSIQENIVTKEQQKFIYKGFQDYSYERMGDNFKLIPHEPTSLVIAWQSLRKMVNKPSTAIKIATAIFESKFGHQFIKEQTPFKVTLINDKVWQIKGSKGALIYLQKADAQILSVKKWDNEN